MAWEVSQFFCYAKSYPNFIGLFGAHLKFRLSFADFFLFSAPLSITKGTGGIVAPLVFAHYKINIRTCSARIA
jgi:hypothetical protein